MTRSARVKSKIDIPSLPPLVLSNSFGPIRKGLFSVARLRNFARKNTLRTAMASRVAATQAVLLCCRKGLRTQAWPVVHPIGPPKPPPATEPGIQRVQEEAFDKVVEREKDYLFVSRMRKLAMQKPERYVELSDLSPEDRLLSPVLENYPAVFELVREGSRRCWTEWYRLTLRAEQLSSEEENVMKQMEDHFVTVLRKVLMLSIGRRLPLEKLGYLAPHLGLPNDFERRLVYQYPHFLHVVTLKDSTPLLKLTSWDAQLALSLEEVKKHQVLQSKASGEYPFSRPTD